MSSIQPVDKETIINFNESEKEAYIFTYSKKIQKHFEQVLKINPNYTNSHGGKEYTIDKSRIPLPRKPRKLSAEARNNIGERLKNAREVKSERKTNPR